MLIRCGYQVAMTFVRPTALITMLAVRDDQNAANIRHESHSNSLSIAMSDYRDFAGNRCQRLLAPAGMLMLEGDAILECNETPDPYCPEIGEVRITEVPDSCLVYLMGSRYCETDRLSTFAWDMFGSVPPGWGRVQAIVDFVHDHIRFGYADASSTRTAFETLQEQVGVCRDFAHLAITLCRCLNIPARYVNGHLGDIGVPIVNPMDFHAWMEVYLAGGWYVFDPRNNARRIGRIVVARGRDAADVPLVNSFGPHELNRFQVWTYEVP